MAESRIFLKGEQRIPAVDVGMTLGMDGEKIREICTFRREGVGNQIENLD